MKDKWETTVDFYFEDFTLYNKLNYFPFLLILKKKRKISGDYFDHCSKMN